MSLYIVDIHGDIEGDYEIIGKYEEPFMNKPCVSEKVCEHDKNAVLDKLRAEIAEYGSICVEYKLTDRRDKDIEQLVTDVLKQAKKQVLDVIDKYKTESEEGTADGDDD